MKPEPGGGEPAEMEKSSKRQLPWEIRIKQNTFETITITARTGSQKFNYFDIEKNGQLMVGYHSAQETYDRTLGTLVQVSGTDHLLLLDQSVDDRTARFLVPTITRALAEKANITISRVVAASEIN